MWPFISVQRLPLFRGDLISNLASMATASTCLSPYVLARQNHRSSSKPSTTRKPDPDPKPRSGGYKSRRQLPHSSAGSEAITYTRLPPKEEFFTPSIDPLLFYSTEVKLSDLSAVIDSNASSVSETERGSKSKSFQSTKESDQGEVQRGDIMKSGKVIESAEEGEEEKEKEKGVPAVMRCFDRAKIYVKAGDGGNGVVAFRREKFVPLGGPSGADGGRGGNVFVEVDGEMNSLLLFRKNIHFRAGRGENGQGKKQVGAKGEDVIVKVSPGTVIREASNDGVQGAVLLELLYPGQRALLLRGGRGGRGNAAFKSGLNKAPKIAENGEEGPELWLELELKLVADVGIVGAPNAGKSTLLSAISAAQPTIANYPFTTLLPNLGVVSLDYHSTMVVADLPGLLEGAHLGFGLGHEFLRHTERCSALVHVVDGSSPHPNYEYDAVRLELELFNPELSEKPYIIAYNKMDLPEACEKWTSFREMLQARGIEPFCISALKKQGTYEVACAAFKLKKSYEAHKEASGGWTAVQENLDHVADMVQKQRKAPIAEFEIFQDDTNIWRVVGHGLRRFVQMTNWSYTDSLRRFQCALEASGVYKSLKKRGVKEGDTVFVEEMLLVWHDDLKEESGESNKQKISTDSIRWPDLK